MIPVDEALRLVLQHTRPLEPRRLSVEESEGLVLAEEVISDADIPPFDRAAMDGFALRSEDTGTPPVALRIVGEVAAGDDSELRVRSGEAAAISTGAPLPRGADCVQPIEKVKVEDGKVILYERVDRSRHVAPRGDELAAGTTALEPGTVLNPAALGVLAMVGCTEALLVPRPRVAILSTGSELVPPGERPGPGRIRNSNSPMLAAAVRRAGGAPDPLGVARDDPAELNRLLERGLEADMLLLTGGVSVGPHDLVEDALEKAGVEIHFRSVSIKPGKPVTFGTHERGAVFGLPGNPVSALVTFYVFAMASLRRQCGLPDPSPPLVPAELRGTFQRKADRTGYLPAWSEWEEGVRTVRVLNTRSSADLIAASRANALVECPEGEETLAEGTRLQVLPLP